jgi:hypothetical protein
MKPKCKCGKCPSCSLGLACNTILRLEAEARVHRQEIELLQKELRSQKRKSAKRAKALLEALAQVTSELVSSGLRGLP